MPNGNHPVTQHRVNKLATTNHDRSMAVAAAKTKQCHVTRHGVLDKGAMLFQPMFEPLFTSVLPKVWWIGSRINPRNNSCALVDLSQ